MANKYMGGGNIFSNEASVNPNCRDFISLQSEWAPTIGQIRIGVQERGLER